MGDIIHVGGQYYILATSPFTTERTRVLKHGDTFAVFDRYGDIVPIGLAEQGVYHQGTRFVARAHLTIDGRRPLLLSSTVIETNDLLAVDLTNPDVVARGEECDDVVLPHGAIHLFRSKFLWEGTVYERISVTNHATEPAAIVLRIELDADFADIFEVRGTKRAGRGARLPPVVGPRELVLGYHGLDGVVRRTRVTVLSDASELSFTSLRFDLALEPNHPVDVDFTIACEIGDARRPSLAYDEALAVSSRALGDYKARCCRVESSNEQFDDWTHRSVADLFMLVSRTPEGPYPYAGVPWFSTAFGRDGILTGFECLVSHPEIARGVLGHLAATQARAADPSIDAEPGKVLHERRDGEMAALREIPFGRYYGAVDGTPLFMMLAAAYYTRTADAAFIDGIMPSVEAALAWIERDGDLDGDGFVEYERKRATGLLNQGWKDSNDSVFHADGTIAEPPIALAEVQGYVYAAKVGAAALFEARGDRARAAALRDEAARLQELFDERFYCEELGTYALALDGQKRPCRVRASNAGHCLFTGIAKRERAPGVVRALMHESMFSGWGVRTIAVGESRYNPMSYHNGSIWPHDNAVIAAGLARYGFKREVERIATGLFDASVFVELHRMPELFCGFTRRRGEGPTLYPVACAPQAWAAGASFWLVESLLGLEIDAVARRITFRHPVLPDWLKTLDLLGLEVGPSTVDLRVERFPGDVGVRVLGRREENVEIVLVK